MKKAIRYAVLTGMVAASLAGPAAPAGANTCTGVRHDSHSGNTDVGSWECGDTCPSTIHGPLDGYFHAQVCVDPA